MEEMTEKDITRSRLGYIINFAGCPLLWKSQFQKDIDSALSATESKFTVTLTKYFSTSCLFIIHYNL
jgi:hypothetical protein